MKFAGTTYGSPIKPCSCGKPAFGVEVRIVDTEDSVMTNEYYTEHPAEPVEYYQDAEWEWLCEEHYQ